MRILGIDPGSNATGYGVIVVGQSLAGEEQPGTGKKAQGRNQRRNTSDGARGEERLVECGVVRLDRVKDHEMRLKQIYDELTGVIDRCQPDEAAIEMPVYGRNPQSLLKLGRAQAASMLAVLNRGLPIVQYTPKEIKRAVTGQGNAAKEQVGFMVRSILGMNEEKWTRIAHDATDALAVALCHSHRDTAPPASSRSGGWAGFIRDNPERVG